MPIVKPIPEFLSLCFKQLPKQTAESVDGWYVPGHPGQVHGYSSYIQPCVKLDQRSNCGTKVAHRNRAYALGWAKMTQLVGSITAIPLICWLTGS
jgi:hypothetical protein